MSQFLVLSLNLPVALLLNASIHHFSLWKLRLSERIITRYMAAISVQVISPGLEKWH